MIGRINFRMSLLTATVFLLSFDNQYGSATPIGADMASQADNCSTWSFPYTNKTLINGIWSTRPVQLPCARICKEETWLNTTARDGCLANCAGYHKVCMFRATVTPESTSHYSTHLPFIQLTIGPATTGESPTGSDGLDNKWIALIVIIILFLLGLIVLLYYRRRIYEWWHVQNNAADPPGIDQQNIPMQPTNGAVPPEPVPAEVIPLMGQEEQAASGDATEVLPPNITANGGPVAQVEQPDDESYQTCLKTKNPEASLRELEPNNDLDLRSEV